MERKEAKVVTQTEAFLSFPKKFSFGRVSKKFLRTSYNYFWPRSALSFCRSSTKGFVEDLKRIVRGSSKDRKRVVRGS